jgi:predicted unusual protein kinase regulating ubiquinone biosynthesis (AarF/ABC1/UbiB family)
MMLDLLYFVRRATAVFLVIGRIVMRHLWIAYRTSVLQRPLTAHQWQASNVRSATEFVAAAIRLKGGLIKVGQFLSARADVFPMEVLQILARLQDRVDPAPFAEVSLSLQAELAGRLHLVAAIDPTCLAAASFGQVHRAQLLDGRDIVFKVQHRRIERSLAIDIVILRAAFALFGAFSARMYVNTVLKEIASAMRRELDYVQEADNCRRIGAIFAHNATVVIPEVIPELCTRRILALSYIDGVKITDVDRLRAAGIDPRALMEIVTEAYCLQMYSAGFFQCDPHPGNLFGLPGPRLAIVDFGLAKTIPPPILVGLRRALFGVLNHDGDGFAQGLVLLGVIREHDRPTIMPMVHKLFAHIHTGSSREVKELQREIVANAREVYQDIRSVLSKVEQVTIPQDLVLYGRAISLLQGLATQIAPEMEIFTVMMPHMLRYLGDQRAADEDAPQRQRATRRERRAAALEPPQGH